MTASQNVQLDRRVLLLTPTAKDADFSQRVLGQIGIESLVCHSVQEMCQEAERGAGLLLLTQESLRNGCRARLEELLRNQPRWSDLPVLLLLPAGTAASSGTQEVQKLGHMTFIPRPVQLASLLSTIQAGLRDRERQYQVRDYLAEREIQSQSLKAAAQRKDEFLATLAHELRNPLAPLRSGLDLLLLGEQDGERREEVIEVMDRQVNQMIRLIDDLLDVARINGNKLELRLERVELDSIVRTAIESTQNLIADAGLQLLVTLPPQPIYLHADAARLAQIFANLLNNSAKYTEPGGKIEFSATVLDGSLQIEISDTGVGIPPQMLNRIFDMFAQVETSFNRSRGGLGIGLTLVQRLVQMHGGQISAASAGIGCGSTFVVTLPIISGPDSRKERSPRAVQSHFRPRRILVVDDTQGVRYMLSRLLERLGQQVWTAASAEAALQSAREIVPEVIISDIGMPLVDGYELAQQLRRDPLFAQTTLVALTGYGQDQDRLRSREAGFDQHLVKPVSITSLTELLARTGS